jgi:hypothetical protein
MAEIMARQGGMGGGGGGVPATPEEQEEQEAAKRCVQTQARLRSQRATSPGAPGAQAMHAGAQPCHHTALPRHLSRLPSSRLTHRAAEEQRHTMLVAVMMPEARERRE